MVDHADGSADDCPRLIAQVGQKIRILKATTQEGGKVQLQQERIADLAAEELVIGASNGLIVVENASTGKTRSLFVRE